MHRPPFCKITPYPISPLGEAEIIAALCDCFNDLRAKYVVAVILGEIKFYQEMSVQDFFKFGGQILMWERDIKHTVKAGVRRWKAILVSVVTVDIESIYSVHSFKFLESVERDLACTSDKLQQLG
jgi:hypothetical protein